MESRAVFTAIIQGALFHGRYPTAGREPSIGTVG
jgi:hypothetical protein